MKRLKKSKIIIIIMVLLLIVGCNKKDEDGYLIGTSNKTDNSKLQVKVTTDKIYIRNKASVNSEKIGVVLENSVFDVISYNADSGFVWFLIKTDNDINGYISTKSNMSYLKPNKDIDTVPPEISVSKNEISVDKRSKVDEAIKKNVSFSDDKDQNPVMEYNVNYNNLDSNIYSVEIIVKDSSGNESRKNIELKITGEKKMKDGTWMTYQEMLSKQKKVKSLCSKYNLSQWRDAIGCVSNNSTYDISIANNTGTTRIGFNKPFTFCNYDEKLNPYYCEDGNGNEISHDLISSKLKSLEKTWLEKFKKFTAEVKTTTGYDLYELVWQE